MQFHGVMEERHSKLGIASFSISIAVGVLMLALFVVAGLLNAGRVQRGGEYPGQMLVGFAMIGLVAADVVAVGLGIAAITRPGTKRIFGLLGLIFSSLTILGGAGLVVIGLVYASMAR